MIHRTRRRILICLVLLAVAGAAGHVVSGARDAVCVPAGQWAIPDGGRADPLAVAQVFARLAGQQVVLLGENHENREHHRWELYTVAGLHALRPDMVLGFEMFPRRVQPVLDRWVAGELTAEQLLTQTEWSKVWGFDPSLYLPLFEFARMNRVPMVALNVDRTLISRVGEGGWSSIPPADREGVSDPAPAAPGYLAVLYESFLEHHAGESGASMEKRAPGDADLADPKFRRFVEGQQLWDRAMAQRLAERLRPEASPLVVGIMGSGHLRDGYGVPFQLKDLGVRSVATALPWDEDDACGSLHPGLATVVYGVQARPAPEPPRPRLGIAIEPATGGVRVREVTQGSPADQAGLRAGDLITRAASEPVADPADLIATVRRQPPGTILPLTVQRGEQAIEILARFPAGQ